MMPIKIFNSFQINKHLALVTACFTIFLCANYAVQAQPLPERRPLSGRVVGPDGTPLKGATVLIRQQIDIANATFWGARVATNANGEFSFPDAEEGSYKISIVSPGFAAVNDKLYTVDENTPPLTVKMERLATLPLRIRKPDNSVLPGTVVAVQMQPAQLPPLPLQRVTTDANGDAALPGLIPGTYTVQALVEGVGVVTRRDVEVLYSEKPAALELSLQAGGTLRIASRESINQAEPRAVGGATVTFTTASPESDAAKLAAGNFPDDMMIYVRSMQTAPTGGAAIVTSDGDGVLQITDVAPGTYTVRLFSPLHKQVTEKTVEIKANEIATADFIVEPLSPVAPLDVLVRDIKDQPVADTEFLIQLRPGSNNTFGGAAPPPAPDVPVAIRNLFNSGNYIRRARTDKDGKLTLYPVQPGKWRVNLIVPPTADGNPGSSAKDATVTAEGGTVTIPVTLPAPAAK